MAGLIGVNSIEVVTQTPILDQDSNQYYIETTLPRQTCLPFAFRIYNRTGWDIGIQFVEGIASQETWRIYFLNTPSGVYGGKLYYVTI